MSRIFICYRREDSNATAGRIYDYLERKFGAEAIFKDVNAIDAGDNFQERINDAVDKCQVMLVLIGRRWLQVTDSQGRRRLDNPADWVRVEIEIGLRRDIRVIPVLLDGVEMPPAQNLPMSLQPLCLRHAAQVRHDPDFQGDIYRVLDVIERQLNSGKIGIQHFRLQTLRQRSDELKSSRLCSQALTKQKIGDLEGAITDYNRAIQLKPDFTKAYYERSSAKRTLGKLTEAIADCDKAIQLKPDFAFAYYERSSAKRALGKLTEAIADCDKAIQLKPDFAFAYYGRGTTKLDLAQQPEVSTDLKNAFLLQVLADFNKAIQLKPDFAFAYCGLGSAKFELKKLTEAIADYDKAIKLQPDLADAYHGRGNTKSHLNKKQGAIDDLQKAIELYEHQGNTGQWYEIAQKRIQELKS